MTRRQEGPPEDYASFGDNPPGGDWFTGPYLDHYHDRVAVCDELLSPDNELRTKIDGESVPTRSIVIKASHKAHEYAATVIRETRDHKKEAAAITLTVVGLGLAIKSLHSRPKSKSPKKK